MKCLINIDGQFDWLETQVRDAALKIKDELPKSDVNREYYLQVRVKNQIIFKTLNCKLWF